MRKGTDLFNLPVIAFTTGEKIERVVDLIFDAPSNAVLGFLVDDGGFFSKARVLPLNKVKSIGVDAVIVEDSEVIVVADQDDRFKEIVQKDHGLKGKKVMTEDGKDLGTVTDLYFDELAGRLEGYEVSGGLFADAYSGRSYVPAPMILKIGEDVLFVPTSTITLMEEQTGGIKGAFQDAADKMMETAVEARDRVKEMTRAAGEKLDQAGTTTREKAQEVMAQQSVDQAFGRRAHDTVRGQNGRIIVAQGQIITSEMLEKVKEEKVETELLKAVGSSPAEMAKHKAKNTAEGARDTLAEGVENVKHQASELWGQLKEKATDLKDQASTEFEQRRIKQVLGLPVNRVILDSNDKIILNTGDLVTHESVERARKADVLNILLSSINMKSPEFSKEEVRAGQK